ncbi:MAG: hypothetical protein IPL23_27765 [Saprospiraceae bacterium]|nr:hypothetical protein [Saprospiraceae bacterium]
MMRQMMWIAGHGDSKQIYFTSSRSNRYSGYQVSIDGQNPVRLFDHYFNNVHNVVEHLRLEKYFQ